MTRSTATSFLAVAAVAVAVVLAGCGISDPDATTPRPATATWGVHRAASPQHAGPSLPAPGDERALLGRFARTWVTYTSRTLQTQQRVLASLAIGALARQLDHDAAGGSPTQDVRVVSLRCRGTVEAIVIRPHTAAIVVAREALSTDGRTQTSWAVYLAAVVDTGRGLRVATWTPVSGD